MLVRRSSPANQWSYIMAYASSIKERELAKLRTLRAEFAERAEASRRTDEFMRRAEKAQAQDELDWGRIKATSYRIKMGGRK
jgi:hypothetical protein